MNPRLPILMMIIGVAVLTGGEAAAQLHKDTRLGFQLKPPRKFEAIALQPGTSNPVVKYQAENTDWVAGGGGKAIYYVSFYPSERLRRDQSREEFAEELWERFDELYGYPELTKTRETKIGRSPILERHVETDFLGIYHTILDEEDGFFVFEGQALKERFDKHVKEFSKATKSFKRIDKDDADEREADLAQMDKDDRFLQEQIDRLPPGWSWTRTPRYLFLYNADKDFVKELGEQIEVIRETYRELYPPEKPIEAISIVRVCADRSDYLGYGGSPSAAAYFSSGKRELVMYDKAPRDETRAVLNHEAFHQYIYYFYGELAPHSWYNEGHGRYFQGAKMTRSYRVTDFGDAPGRNQKSTVKNACRLRAEGKSLEDGAAAPLRELMRYTQREYYARAWIHYPQGWALIHMLRESTRLEPKWERILADYLENLVAAREEVSRKTMERALDQAEKKEEGSSESMSKEVEDYYKKADTDEIQKLAYEMTFEGWSDADWDEFEAFYLKYVEKL